MNNPDHQGADGVIKLQFADMSLVRAMLEIYNRNATSSDLRRYIKQYLSVQYNAVMDFGTVPGTNHYANSYIGPPQDQFTSAGQIRSQIVLLGAISLYGDGELPVSSQGPRPDPETPHPRFPTSVNVGAIAGSIVGGVFLVGAVVFWLSRRRRPSQAGPNIGHAAQFAVDPFPIELFVDEALASTSRAGRKRHTIAAPAYTTTPPGLIQVSARENRPELSTAQLVDLIIARMQPTRQLGEDDMPPDYSEGSRR
ncbi:hypothetical protein VNI00_015798 [Paramarasmius palmivorus]|uniref:Uncharacterized protein n=1 Tax=Paramarasmius palmivorus TaxID=297713 RepID=A0AAW0BHW4_9AGAR